MLSVFVLISCKSTSPSNDIKRIKLDKVTAQDIEYTEINYQVSTKKEGVLQYSYYIDLEELSLIQGTNKPQIIKLENCESINETIKKLNPAFAARMKELFSKSKKETSKNRDNLLYKINYKRRNGSSLNLKVSGMPSVEWVSLAERIKEQAIGCLSPKELIQ